jgi:hypothetical protein
MQHTKEDRQWEKTEAQLRGIYGGLKCKECGILLVSKYATDCRERFDGKIPEILKPMPKNYWVQVKLMHHATQKEINSAIKENGRNPDFLNGRFLGLHLIRGGYCMSCDTDQKDCIFACKQDLSTQVH